MFNSLLLLMCAEKYVCVGKWCTLIRGYILVLSQMCYPMFYLQIREARLVQNFQLHTRVDECGEVEH